MKRLRRIEDLEPDPRNANLGTERGTAMLEQSIEQNGMGRSIVTDRNGIILAGNKTYEAAGQIGIRKLVVVETDGDALIVHVRKDLDRNQRKAQRLAIADNRVGEVNLEWDRRALRAVHAEIDLTGLFSEAELGVEGDEEDEEKESCPACGRLLGRRKAKQGPRR